MPAYLLILPWSLDSLGGVSQVVQNLYCQIKCHNDYTPILMVNSWDDRNIRKITIQDIEHYFLRLRSVYDNKRPAKNFLAFLAFFFLDQYKIYRFLKDQEVAIVNLHYCDLYALNFSLLKVLGLFRGKLLLSFHGKYLFSSPNNGVLAKMLWKLLLRTSDKVIACSEALKEEVRTIDTIPDGKIVAIHNGISTSFVKHERDRDYQLNKGLKGRKFVLNVATFEYNKGQDILLKAFAKIESLFPEVDLVMIGRPELFLHGLKNLIRDLDLEDRVWIYEGLPHSRMAAFYESATIFALPSRYEPFGIVILEAGVFELPVAASCVGGVKEILTHNLTGRLCEPDNIESLAFEIKYLLENEEERERLGKNLKSHIMESFTWEHAYRKYIECTAS
jgi:glycosyltransferase involved in cell wall biosynthesis